MDLFSTICFSLHPQGPFSGVRTMSGTPSLSTFGCAVYILVQDLHTKVFWISIWVRDGVTSSCIGGIAMGGIHLR